SGQITSLEQLNATMAIATGGWDTYAKSSTDAAGIVEVASNQVKAAFQGVFQTSAQIQKEFNKTQVEADKLAKGLIDLEQTFGVDLPTSVASSEESLKAAGEALKQFQKDTEPLRDISGLEKAFKLKIDAEDDVKEFLKGLPKGLEKEIKFNINVASNIKEFKEIFDILSAGLFEQQGLEIKLKPNFDASEAEKIAKEFMHTIEDHFGKEGKNSTLMAGLFADLKASIKAGTIQQDIVGIFQDHGFLAKVDQAAVGIGNTVAQGVSKGIIDLQTRAPTAGDKASQERLKKQFQGQPQGPDESFKLDEIDQPAVIPAPVKDPNFDTNIQQAKTDIASVSTTPQTPVVIPAPDSTEFVNAMNTLLAVPADFNARMAAAFTSTPLVIPAPDQSVFADATNTLLLIPADFATRFNESFGKNGLVVPAPVIDEFIAGLDQASTNAAAFIETFNNAMGGGGGGGKKKKKGGGGLVIPAPNIEQYVGGIVAAIEIATQFPQAFTDSFGKEGLMIPALNIDEFIAGLDLASTAALGFIETFNNAMGGGGSGGGAGGGKKKKKKGGGGLIIPAPDSAQ